MTSTRRVHSILRSVPTMEGAGVQLKRAFGFHQVPLLDPFLLLDDFHSDNPEHYMAGFPWHPHRGIETVTYVLAGEVEHGDSLGNAGVIGPGDVQWMTAGSGLIHQEMPKMAEDKLLQGFQLWVNLPATSKMMKPRYQEVKASEIPEVELEGGVKVKVVAGELAGVKGPVRDIVLEPEYLDVSIPPNGKFEHLVPEGHKLFAYTFRGSGFFEPDTDRLVEKERLVLYDDGGPAHISAGDEGLRFLLISGKPLGEPVAWGGPIVMNTQEELALAFEEYRAGTFIKGK